MRFSIFAQCIVSDDIESYGSVAQDGHALNHQAGRPDKALLLAVIH